MKNTTEQHTSTDTVVLSIDGKSLAKRIQQAAIDVERRGTGGKVGTYWCSQFWELVGEITDGIDYKPTQTAAKVGGA